MTFDNQNGGRWQLKVADYKDTQVERDRSLASRAIGFDARKLFLCLSFDLGMSAIYPVLIIFPARMLNLWQLFYVLNGRKAVFVDQAFINPKPGSLQDIRFHRRVMFFSGYV